MDSELSTYIVTASKAWQTFAKSKKTATDMLALGLAISAVEARAKILWIQAQYPQVWIDVAEIGLEAWQAIIDDPKAATSKMFADAVIRTSILEETRDRLEKYGKLEDDGLGNLVWLTLAKISPPVLIYGLISGKITPQEIAADVQGTAKKLAAAAPGIGTGILVGLGLLAAIVILK